MHPVIPVMNLINYLNPRSRQVLSLITRVDEPLEPGGSFPIRHKGFIKFII